MEAMESFAQIRRTIFPGQIDESGTSTIRPVLLIIDDNIDIIDALRTVLESRYRLITCLSYEEAERSILPEAKVVLLDIKMAGKDGLEAFHLLKKQRPDLQIVFHSAYPGSSEKAAEISELNASGYLTKGEYQTPELLAVLETAFNQSMSVHP